jgi:hypothetical protein
VEFHTGVEKSMRLPLTIYQEGHQPIMIARADYASRSLKLPVYWCFRIARWWKDEGLQAEMIHHKFFLLNRPPEVQHFEMTHGFNTISLNYARHAGKFIWNAGVGSVLLHAENTVRGMELHSDTGIDLDGYRLTGIVMQGAIGRRVGLSSKFFLNLEFKTLYSAVRVPVVQGHAKANILTFQLLAGLGFLYPGNSD